eukprot:1876797-Rhodomonas_salina.1
MEQLRQEGNAAFKAGDFPLAIAKYDAALALCSPSEAHVNLVFLLILILPPSSAFLHAFFFCACDGSVATLRPALNIGVTRLHQILRTNRSLCNFKLGRIDESLSDAISATLLRQDWAKAWCRKVCIAICPWI